GRFHHLFHVRHRGTLMLTQITTITTTWPILSLTTFLPILGVILIYLSRGEDAAAEGNARWIALWTTLITFAVSVLLVLRFDINQSGFQFEEKLNWLAPSIGYH